MFPRKTIGLIPAGGQATRIAPLPCSKEVYPVGFRAGTDKKVRPKVACHYLLEKMRIAGITEAYIVLRQGKWDIPAYLCDGALADMRLAYLLVTVSFGAPYTLDQAYPFVRDAVIVLGFPDILFQPDDAFKLLLARQTASDADVVLGLFPADRPQKVDMVDLDESGRIRQIVIKPRQTHLYYTWGIAVWKPTFTHFLHEYVNTRKHSATVQPELFIGDVIQAAIHEGLYVEALEVSKLPFLDIGTPEDLLQAIKTLSV